MVPKLRILAKFNPDENVLPSTEYRWLHNYNEFWLLATNQANNRKIHVFPYFKRLRAMERFLTKW